MPVVCSGCKEVIRAGGVGHDPGCRFASQLKAKEAGDS